MLEQFDLLAFSESFPQASGMPGNKSGAGKNSFVLQLNKNIVTFTAASLTVIANYNLISRSAHIH